MTLFGQNFAEDPRYHSISDVLFDLDEMGRMRRTKPLVEPMVDLVWGTAEAREGFMAQAHAQMSALLKGERPQGGFPSCQAPLTMLRNWPQGALDQDVFVARA